MSIKINRNNLFLLLSNFQSDFIDRIDSFTNNDFTIYTKVKIIKPDLLGGSKHGYIFSLSGQHSGLSYFITDNNNVIISFNYWMINEDGEHICLDMSYTLPKESESEFNEYYIICDESSKTLRLYINWELKSSLNYDGFKKVNYEDAIMWIGCGNMLMNDLAQRVIGNFEIDSLIGADKNINLANLKDFIINYKEKYSNLNEYDGFMIINEEIEKLYGIKFFLTFDLFTEYKIWNMINNGNFFRKYIPQNIMF